jgi:hypothetical protein
MDGVCVVLGRRKEWRERLCWGLLVVIVNVEVGSGENSVSLNRDGCWCVGRVKSLIVNGSVDGACDDVSRDDVSWRIWGLL